MGQGSSSQQAGDLVSQVENPLSVFGENFVTDGMKALVVRADPRKTGKNAITAEGDGPSWVIRDRNGKEWYKVDYRFKFTQTLYGAKRNPIATLDKDLAATMYTKKIFLGQSFEDEDYVANVSRKICASKACMSAKIFEGGSGTKPRVKESLVLLGSNKDRTFVVRRNGEIIAKTLRMDGWGVTEDAGKDTYYLEMAAGVDSAFVVVLAVAMNRFMRKK